MSSATDLSNLVENEVFDDNEPAFPPALPTLQRPTMFTSPMQQQPPLPSAEGTPLRDARLKLAHRMEGLRTIILAFAVFSFGLTVALVIELFIGAPPVTPRGGVSSSSDICSNIGVEQLKKGGSAVDAAISVMLCIGVVRPQSGGLGGGGFMMIHDHKTHNTTLLDFREVAPKYLHVVDQETLVKGGLSVGVPGELAGMYHSYKLFGKLPWSDLFTPVIKLAEEGWVQDKKDEVDLSRRLQDLTKENYMLFRQTFGAGQGLMRRKDLADLLRKLSTSEDEAFNLFYKGPLAKEIVETVQLSGGVMTAEDLSTYSVRIREPLVATFRDFKIITAPAPSSGSLLIHMLNELDSVKTRADVGTVDYYAKLAEVTSKAYKCRALLGDPDDELDGRGNRRDNVPNNEMRLMNNTINVDEDCELAISKMSPDDHGTSHINVIDSDEMMVSITSSLNYWFGSMLMTSSGVLLNNEMADFGGINQANSPKAGKRPLSSMVPTIVYHEKRACLQRMAIGGTNGTKIPSSVVQTLMNLLVKGDDLPTAVEAPKIVCNAKKCQLEEFEKANEVAASVHEKLQLPVEIVHDKLSTVGIVMKLNSTVDGYIEKSSYGNASIY